MTESRIVAWLRWKLEVYVHSGFGSSAEDLVSATLGPGIYAYQDASVAMVVFERGLTYRAADCSFDCLYTDIERLELTTLVERMTSAVIRPLGIDEIGRLSVYLGGREHVVRLPMQLYSSFSTTLNRVVRQLVPASRDAL